MESLIVVDGEWKWRDRWEVEHGRDCGLDVGKLDCSDTVVDWDESWGREQHGRDSVVVESGGGGRVGSECSLHHGKDCS